MGSSRHRPRWPSCELVSDTDAIEAMASDFASATVDGTFRLAYLLRNTVLPQRRRSPGAWRPLREGHRDPRW
jgi:hypothetical protein